MKTMIRSAFVMAMVAILSGCGVPKEQYQQLQDKLNAKEQEAARMQQDLTTAQNTLAAKDAEINEANQRAQGLLIVVTKQSKIIDTLKAGKPSGTEKATGVKTTPKGKATTTRHTTKKTTTPAPSGF